MDSNITVNNFKIKPQGNTIFSLMVKKYNSLRFSNNPSYCEDYTSISFTIDENEYQNLLNECISKDIYYYI